MKISGISPLSPLFKCKYISYIFLFILFITITLLYTQDWNHSRGVWRGIAYAWVIFGLLGFFLAREIYPIPQKYENQDDANSWSHPLTSIVLLLLLLVVYFYHYFHITTEFRDRFFLGERDFSSLGEIILNTGRGLGFYSPFHGDGDSSFLNHHFSPSIIVFYPWIFLANNRLGLAWGHGFYAFAILLILCVIFYNEWKRNYPNRKIQNFFGSQYLWFFLWIYFLLTNIYFYRILFSYHFEILYVFYFLSLLLVRHSLKRSIVWEWILVILILTTKEDTAVYLSIYYFGDILYGLINLKKSGLQDSFPKKNLILDFWGLVVCTSYFFLILPYIRQVGGWTAEENWMSIWGHWVENNQSSFWGVWKGAISRPEEIFTVLKGKIPVGWEILASFGFLTIITPRYWFFLINVMLIHFLSGRDWHNSFYNYYIYSILPVLAISSAQGMFSIIRSFSFQKSFLIIGIALAIVSYRNSGDATFPFTNTSLPSKPIDLSIHNTTLAIENATAEEDSLLKYAETIPLFLEKNSTTASQFDLGIWVPIDVKLFPISENPRLANGDYPDYILTNTRTGFSPYINLEIIEQWEKNWEKNFDYSLFKTLGDIKIWKRVQ